MATIKLFTKDDLLTGKFIVIQYDGTVGEFIADAYYEDGGCRTPFQVFDGEPSIANEITRDFEKLINGNGSYTIIETPGTGLEVGTILAIVSLVVSVAAILLAPKPELPENVNRRQQSPNNYLSGRNNEPRPLQRIPDICGEVLSIPDIIMPPYYRYNENKERIEFAYYCVGRGKVFIEPETVKDGDTPIQFIERASAGIYYPFHSPNNQAADIEIGTPINTEIITAYRSNEVNGLDIIAPQDSGLTPIEINAWIAYTGQGFSKGAAPYTLAAVDVNHIRLARSGGLGWLPNDYAPGKKVILLNFYNYFFKTNMVDYITVNYSGTWTISSISSSFDDGVSFYDIYIVEALPQNPSPGSYPNNQGVIFSYDYTTSIRTETGAILNQWYYMTKEKFSSGFINIVAQNGLFHDTGGAVYNQVSLDYLVEVENLDKNGQPTGEVQSFTPNFAGNENRAMGITVDFSFPSPTKFRLRVKRTTAKFTGTGAWADRTSLLDLYGVVPVTKDHFGDITTIQTLTVENSSAAAVKERRLNCIAVEGIKKYNGLEFETEITKNLDDDGNSSAVQSFIKLAKDIYVGNRTNDELNLQQLFSMDNEMKAYFGNSDSNGFNYTFDSTDISFQEIAQTIFNAVNSIVYREGTQISARFEKPQPIPSMLFTHRSKEPNTEKYGRNFNQATIFDGVEFNYVDPDKNTTERLIYPSGSINNKVFNIPGIRNLKQAKIRAKRELNKIRYAKETCEVTVTAEGRFIRPNDKVAIVKGTRVRTFDGEIIGQSGLVLSLSQDVSFEPGDTHSITLKNEDGTVENIACTAGASPNKVVLANVPSGVIRTGTEERRTEFSFSSDSRRASEYWMVQQIDNTDKWFVKLQAINYTDDYYKDDLEKLNAFSKAFSKAFS